MCASLRLYFSILSLRIKRRTCLHKFARFNDSVAVQVRTGVAMADDLCVRIELSQVHEQGEERSLLRQRAGVLRLLL